MSYPLSFLLLSNAILAIFLLVMFGIFLNAVRKHTEQKETNYRLLVSRLWDMLDTIEQYKEIVPDAADYRVYVDKCVRRRWMLGIAEDAIGRPIYDVLKVPKTLPDVKSDEYSDLNRLSDKLETLYGTATAAAEVSADPQHLSYLQLDMSNEALLLFKAFNLNPGQLYFNTLDGRLYKKIGEYFIKLELIPTPGDAEEEVEADKVESDTQFALVSVRRLFGMVLEAQLVLCPREEATHRSITVFSNGESLTCYAKKAV